MKRRSEKRQKWFGRMRPYIVRHLFGIGTAAVVVVALCWGWPVYDGVAQADDAAADAILTVGQCIGANTTIGPLEETLIKEDIIEEDLLRTKVTDGMCKDMLEPIPDGTPARKLGAAQNYIQEINLIERAMREAAGEAATRGTDQYYSSRDESLVLFRTIAQTSEQVPALAQYDGPGGDGPGGDGPGGIEPRQWQAAAAASAGEDDNASIAERLRQKEAALKKEGVSAPEAAAGGRCSLEFDLLDEKADEIKGLEAYKIKPLIPEKMGHEETEQAGLVVSPVTKEILQEIRQKHGDVAEASESGIGCVRLTDRMKATLVPYHSEELGTRGHQPDIRELSSNRNTRWGWDITAHRTGNLKLLLHLRYAISRKGQEFRLVPGSPVYDEAIKVTLQSDSTQKATEQKATERPWWQRIFGGIFERIFELFRA
jgi:hypothetical protein